MNNEQDKGLEESLALAEKLQNEENKGDDTQMEGNEEQHEE